ncbi:hypothetical protein AAG906_005889 [Vitis piasezkii]
MACAFKKRVKPRPLWIGDLVRKSSGLVMIRNPRGSSTQLSGPYFIVELTRGRMIDGFRWKPILRANQCRSAKEVLCLRPWSNPSRVRYSLRIIITHIIISSFCFICLLIDIIFTLGILRTDLVVFGLPDHEAPRSFQLGPHFSTLGCHHVGVGLHFVRILRGASLESFSQILLSDIVVVLGRSYVECLDSHVTISVGQSFSHISVTVSITRPRCIVFASLTIIPELFIDMSSQRSVARDS